MPEAPEHREQIIGAVLTLFFVAHVMLAGSPTGLAAQADDPDRLYADRARLTSALEAAAIWESRLTENPRDFEAAWKLARACYWLGGHVAPAERRQQYERGIAAGERAVALEPSRPEGHFWLAADMGALAESSGLRTGLRYRARIKRELEIVLALSPAFEEGAADRALGRWYAKVPRLFGGSTARAVEHLRQSLTYEPANAASRFFLGETYRDMGRADDARVEFQRVLDAPPSEQWGPEVAEFKEKAHAELAKLR